MHIDKRRFARAHPDTVHIVISRQWKVEMIFSRSINSDKLARAKRLSIGISKGNHMHVRRMQHNNF
jgi:hypothetical protein